jgi:CRP-like cAMP-binding protein
VTASCLAERLEHYLTLTQSERQALQRLEQNERKIRRGGVIRRERDTAHEMFVVRTGWVYSYVLLDDGSRQILRLHFPGELVGTSSAAFAEATDSLVALTDVTLCPFDKGVLRSLYQEHPRLAGLLFVLAQAERVSLTDRLASLGRTSAKSRVAALLLDAVNRLRLTDGATTDTFQLPLTQEEIGDATGLTAVHVNRMMRALVDEQLIARVNHHVTLLDEPRLARVGNFVNRYAELDIAWLPQPRQ